MRTFRLLIVHTNEKSVVVRSKLMQSFKLYLCLVPWSAICILRQLLYMYTTCVYGVKSELHSSYCPGCHMLQKPKTSRLKTTYPTSSNGSVTPDRSAVKSSKHVDPKVAARNAALNSMGGVKVDVFVRVRPPNEREQNDTLNVVVSKETQEIILKDPNDHEQKYKYDKVYGPDTSQLQIYEDAVAPIIEQVARGMSCAIFAYGQTGSGKTYTMRGPHEQGVEDPGVIQRAIGALFERLPEQDYTDIAVSVSFLEIYNEELLDMLNPNTTQKLMLVDSDNRGTVCHGMFDFFWGLHMQ